MTHQEGMKYCNRCALYAALLGSGFLALLIFIAFYAHQAGQESILPKCPPGGYRVTVPAGTSFVKEMKRGGKVRVTLEFENAADAYKVASQRDTPFYVTVRREKR